MNPSHVGLYFFGPPAGTQRMKIFVLALSFSLATSLAPAAVLAGPFTNASNGHFYFLLSPDTWTNSEAQAMALGGHLVTINDTAENAWVVQTFARYGRQDHPLWIGLTDRDTEGNFVWANGETGGFFNWNRESGEPNNSAGSGYEEDFTYIIQANAGNPTLISGQWNDAPGDGFGVARPICGVVEVEPLGKTGATVARTVPWLLIAALGGLFLLTLILLAFLVKHLRAERSPCK